MIFSLLFYVLLALAALTSTISLHEVVTAYLNERFKIGRNRAAMLVTGFCVVTGILSSLSLGAWDAKFFPQFFLHFPFLQLGFLRLARLCDSQVDAPVGRFVGLLVCGLVFEAFCFIRRVDQLWPSESPLFPYLYGHARQRDFPHAGKPGAQGRH